MSKKVDPIVAAAKKKIDAERKKDPKAFNKKYGKKPPVIEKKK